MSPYGTENKALYPHIHMHSFLCHNNIPGGKGGRGIAYPSYPPLPTPLTINSQSDTILPPETNTQPTISPCALYIVCTLPFIALFIIFKS